MEELGKRDPRTVAGSDEDDEDEDDEVKRRPSKSKSPIMGFNDQSVRSAFIKKVFILVTLMFAITAAFSAVPIVNKEFRKWCHKNWWAGIIAIIVFMVFYIILSCCSGVRRCFPCNFVILVLFTLSAATMTMFITASYDADAVLIALLITTCASFAIIIFAATTKRDLTSCLGIAFILGVCLSLFGIMAFIFCLFFNWEFLYVIYSALGALLCMLYLAIDVQMIMGGRRVEISPDEYIFAATHVFVDILTMFLNILGVVGRG